MSKWVSAKKIIPANEDEQSEQFEVLVSELEKAGIEQYEISNFSKLNAESKHNSNYWKGKHYLGIGPSAHSFNGVSRSWNISNNRKYIHLIGDNQGASETEILSIEDQFNELILIGLTYNRFMKAIFCCLFAVFNIFLPGGFYIIDYWVDGC